MTDPITLPPIKEMLPVIRKAYEDKTLQMFQPYSFVACPSYCGPCAIGVCMTEEQRHAADNSACDSYAIDSLISEGVIAENALSEEHDLVSLQRAHDVAFNCSHKGLKGECIKTFGELLTTLEEKYK